MASDNKSLGKFTLDGIPPAPRGVPQIEVTFDIDANGIIKVTAQDKATGRTQHITITASSGLSKDEVERMRQEAEAHAESDKKLREIVEERNKADNACYTAEKALKDLGEKVPADIKKKVEDEVANVRGVMKDENPEVIRKATEKLFEVVQQIGSAAYGAQEAQQAGEAQGTPPSTETPGEDQKPGDDEVVDGEFRNV